MLLLIACADVPDAAATIAWSGYVYASPGSETPFAAGQLSFEPDDGAAVLAEAPFADYPGYWTASLAPEQAFTVRVGTEPVAVWRVTSPHTNANWYGGALFGADGDAFDAFLGAFGVSRPAADEALLIGRPWDDGWACEDVRVADAVPSCFTVDDDGLVTEVSSGAPDYFIASELAPGSVTVSSGLGATEVYPLGGGEVGMAFWFVGSDT